MTTVKEYTTAIKACIGEIMINIHRQSKDEVVLSNLRCINATLFLMVCELHRHGKETKDLETLKSDLNTFYWDMLFVDKTKEEPFKDVIKEFNENMSNLDHKLELMYQFMQVKNKDELFFSKLIISEREGNL